MTTPARAAEGSLRRVAQGDGRPAAGFSRPASGPGVPRPITAVVSGVSALIVIVASAWLATTPGAEQAQTDLVLWFNHPPQPFAAVFAAVNPLFRPVPVILLGIVFLGWVILTARQTCERLEVLRALLVAVTIAEVTAQVMKSPANQPRPLAVVPGLDTHDYPVDPHGNAYPSAHTAMVVAVLCALWPWMRWPQRIVGVVVAVLVALNRIYIGAHWPIDVVGGGAIGLLAAAVVWLIATRWPIRASGPAHSHHS